MYYFRIQRKENYGETYWLFCHRLFRLLNVFTFQLDCGIHPGLTGMDALPFLDLIEANEIDLLLVSQ